MHLASADIQVHSRQRLHTRERLPDPSHLECESGLGRHLGGHPRRYIACAEMMIVRGFGLPDASGLHTIADRAAGGHRGAYLPLTSLLTCVVANRGAECGIVRNVWV